MALSEFLIWKNNMATMHTAPAPGARDFTHIEAQLRACPGIDEALVVPGAARRASGLIAYLAGQGAAQGLGAIQARLAHLLPAAQLPTTFIALDRLPKGSDGQPDHAALPAPDGVALGLRQYEAPRGRTESAVAALWQEVLGLEQVGRQAHFFELGGNSALAVQLVHRLRRELQFEVTMRDLFTCPVLHQFARVLRPATAAPAAAPARIAEYA